MDYQKFKNWFPENKEKIVLGMCYILVFIVGFGTGKFVPQKKNPSSVQSNYITNTNKKPFFPQPAGGGATVPVAAVKGAATSTVSAAPCLIKGNISSAGKKVYHVAGGAFYKRVKPEQCFTTEDEALSAGFIKSSR
jgi:hypothetical protein